MVLVAILSKYCASSLAVALNASRLKIVFVSSGERVLVSSLFTLQSVYSMCLFRIVIVI